MGFLDNQNSIGQTGYKPRSMFDYNQLAKEEAPLRSIGQINPNQSYSSYNDVGDGRTGWADMAVSNKEVGDSQQAASDAYAKGKSAMAGMGANQKGALVGGIMETVGKVAEGVIGGVQAKKAREHSLEEGLLEVDRKRREFQEQQQRQMQMDQEQWINDNFSMRINDNIANFNKKAEAMMKMQDIANKLNSTGQQEESARDQMTAFNVQGV